MNNLEIVIVVESSVAKGVYHTEQPPLRGSGAQLRPVLPSNGVPSKSSPGGRSQVRGPTQLNYDNDNYIKTLLTTVEDSRLADDEHFLRKQRQIRTAHSPLSHILLSKILSTLYLLVNLNKPIYYSSICMILLAMHDDHDHCSS